MVELGGTGGEEAWEWTEAQSCSGTLAALGKPHWKGWKQTPGRRHFPTRLAPRSSFIILYTGGIFGRRTSGKDRRRQSASRSPKGAGRRDEDQ
ncbi:hypothetical protein VULLAG_LOCUS14995 [Vulpes lagopus]